MHSSIDRETNWYAIATVIVFILLCLGMFRWAAYDCQVRAEGLGMARRWNPLIGCFVEVDPGIYADIDSVRWLPGTGLQVVPGD